MSAGRKVAVGKKSLFIDKKLVEIHIQVSSTSSGAGTTFAAQGHFGVP